MFKQICIVILLLSTLTIANTQNINSGNIENLDIIINPKLLNYQGKLTTLAGVPVADSTYSITFRLFNTLTSGSAFWTETQNVQTSQGIFNVLLGSNTVIDTLPQSGNCYLEMQVNPNPAMTPRIRLVSSAYAYLSKKADTANYALSTNITYIDSARIATNSYKLQGKDTLALSNKFVDEGQANAITSSMITDNAVTSVKIQDGTIQLVDLAFTPATRPLTPGISSSEILDGAISNFKIQANAVTTDKIADGTIQRVDVVSAFKAPYADTSDYVRNIPSVNYVDSARVSVTSYNSNKLQGKDTTVLDARYVNEGQPSSVNTLMITDGTITRNDVTPTFKAPLADTADYARVIPGAIDSARVAANAHKLQGKDTLALSNKFVDEGQTNSITSTMITDGNVTMPKINQSGATTGQVLKWTGSAWAPRNDSLGTGVFLPLSGGTMTGEITSIGAPPITMGKANLGVNNTNAGTQAFVAGTENVASAHYSSVSGGIQNTASGLYSTVGGGYQNSATHTNATISGGQNNSATTGAVVGGGVYNYARAGYSVIGGGGSGAIADSNVTTGMNSVIGGGRRNYTTDFAATIGGGINNRAYGQYSVIAGGGGFDIADTNSAIGYTSVISGGAGNATTGDYAVISGGYHNRTANQRTTISGGNQNLATGIGATISGGGYNKARGDYSVISGGGGMSANDSNSITGTLSTIGGGNRNRISGVNSTISGGNNNNSMGTYNTIGGGISNTTNNTSTTVSGGYLNTASNHYATVAGGRANYASGLSATVAGGDSNTASGSYALAAGRKAKAIHNGAFVWADADGSDFSSTAENQFLIRASGNVGINTNTPTSPLTVNGIIHSTSGGIKFPDNSVQTTAASGSGGITSISQGTGITLSPNPIIATGSVSFDQTYGDNRYINEFQTAGGDLTGTYPNPTINDNTVNSLTIADNTIRGVDFALPCTLSTSYPYEAVLNVRNTSNNGYGIRINQGGMLIDSASNDGIIIQHADDDAIQIDSAYNNGILINNASIGASINHAELDGIRVYESEWSGLYVQNAHWSGVEIGDANQHGILVTNATEDGIHVDNAGQRAGHFENDNNTYFTVNIINNTGLGASVKGIYVQGSGYATGGWSTGLGEKSGFAMVSPDIEAVVSGTATLTDGSATISFDQQTRSALSDNIPLKIIVSPNSECNGIFVTTRSANGFSVKELMNGKSNASFDWIAIGRVKGYEQTPEFQTVTAEPKNEKVEQYRKIRNEHQKNQNRTGMR